MEHLACIYSSSSIVTYYVGIYIHIDSVCNIQVLVHYIIIYHKGKVPYAIYIYTTNISLNKYIALHYN